MSTSTTTSSTTTGSTTTVPATAAPRRPLRARWVPVTMPDGRVRLAQSWSPVPAPAHAGRVTLAA